MVRVIRNTKTGEYFQKGKWVKEEASAQVFSGSEDVMMVCAALKLKDVEMVLRIDPEVPEVRVPIPNQ